MSTQAVPTTNERAYQIRQACIAVSMLILNCLKAILSLPDEPLSLHIPALYPDLTNLTHLHSHFCVDLLLLSCVLLFLERCCLSLPSLVILPHTLGLLLCPLDLDFLFRISLLFLPGHHRVSGLLSEACSACVKALAHTFKCLPLVGPSDSLKHDLPCSYLHVHAMK